MRRKIFGLYRTQEGEKPEIWLSYMWKKKKTIRFSGWFSVDPESDNYGGDGSKDPGGE